MDEKTRRVALVGPESCVMQDLQRNVSPLTYIQSTWTRGHAWPSAGPASTDVGGDFSTFRITHLEPGNYRIPNARSNTGQQYSGREYAVDPVAAAKFALDKIPMRSNIYYAQLGSKAISRCLPTNPVADAGTFIGELKRGIPALPGKALLKSKFKDHRQVGSEYLNIEFGWKPIISDLQKFGKAVTESDKILEQLRRDSGKNIRRKFTFPTETEVIEETGGNAHTASALGDSLASNLHQSVTGDQYVRVTTITTRSWFSGCFTYYLNLGTSAQDQLERQAAEARKLFGAELTPATVWNLAPWSWAVDWQGNIGDVLHNVSRFAQDGLVMRYGYIMQETTCKVDWTLRGGARFKSVPRTDVHLSITAVRKERRRATPFGFGFDMTALTGRQTAILGALGIARSPRHL